ncbi:ABC transporter permease [Clostridium sp.]|uniref:ABC transporter permease n=1 Tax=Clostridium sp. TaxID=1506 RepID=UPI0028A24EC4|nr:ABC transporter permease [Clostridium sp.]
MAEFKADDFKVIGCENADSDVINRPNISYFQDAWRRLKKNPVAMTSLVVLVLLMIMVIVGPYINGKEFIQMNSELGDMPPSAEHWFGTDRTGRDLFSRVWFAGRISIAIGVVATIIQVILGSLYGGVMAYFGGWVDEVMMRVIEVITSVPELLLIILMTMVFGNGYVPLTIALTITSWCGTARLIRGQLMQLRESEYVLAAQVLGASPKRIIIKHFIPNTIGVLILNIASSIPSYIFAEAGLSFLGIGLQAPNTSWGSLIAYGRDVMAFYPTQLLFPSLALCITVLAFNLLGDGLRDALDPRLRQ